MSRFQKIAFFGFLVAIAALVYVEASQPTPINWFPSYHSHDKIPYGTYVLHELLENASSHKLENIELPPYEFLQNDSVKGNYFFVNNYIAFDKEELKKILQWTKMGNQVLIASNNLPQDLLDTLEIETASAFHFKRPGTKPMVALTNKTLKGPHPYLLDRDVQAPYFSKIDTLAQQGLGVMQLYNDTLSITKPLLNYLKVPFGKGTIFLHCQPEIFTNYFLLKQDNVQYTENVLAYLNNGATIYWDQYYKSGKKIDISPLHILLNNKYLKWAYYTILIGALLFVLFEGKRKQRKIPIIVPPTNKTYEYTQTISSMYLDKKDYRGIALKQIAFFMEYIRTHLRMSTEKLDRSFKVQLASRTGNDMETTEKLLTYIQSIQSKQYISKEELMLLHQQITQFKHSQYGTKR